MMIAGLGPSRIRTLMVCYEDVRVRHLITAIAPICYEDIRATPLEETQAIDYTTKISGLRP
jgi:hypothetical protein